MRYAVNVPNFGSTADPTVQAELAALAEEAGWDGWFVWDHLLVEPSWSLPIGDPWVILAAVAAATRRLVLGPLVLALPRHAPWQAARAAVSLDQLSAGRLVLGVGLGWPSEAEFGWFGGETEPRRRAEMLDEGLAILDGCWSGRPFAFQGAHYRMREATFLPRPLQPRIPVWVAARRPGGQGPLRRAAARDGIYPVIEEDQMEPSAIAAVVADVRALRAPDAGPFDFVAGGSTPAGDRAAGVARVAAFTAVGATWWQEVVSDRLGGLDAIRARILAGPPRPA